MDFENLLKELKLKSNPSLMSFKYFKKNNEEFLNIKNEDLRNIAKKYYIDLKFDDIKFLLNSKFHEIKLFGVFVLVKKYEVSKNVFEKKEIFDFYLSNSNLFNNWDLVDQSSYKILGNFLIEMKYSDEKVFKILKTQMEKKDIWSKRIVIVSMYSFIKNNELEIPLKVISNNFLEREDLIQKAIGWMLREIGKKDKVLLKTFLMNNIKVISRTSLRYAIEKFDKNERKRFLSF